MNRVPQPCLGLGLLLLLLGIRATVYAVEIDQETTAPIATSTADGGAPGDVAITSDGSIVIAGGTANVSAVTIDSDNGLSNAGGISITDTDGAVGIRVGTGRSTSIYSNGSVLLSEDYTRADDDSDGDLDGPLAIGAARTGLLVEGPDPVSGNINLGSSSVITVEGNASAGIRMTALLQGAFVNDGSLTVFGDGVFGLDMQGGATGSVLQSGSITAQGRDAVGVRVQDPIGGAFVNEGSVTAIGFVDTAVTNYADPDTLVASDTPISERIDAEDLFDAGPAVSIGGGLGQGFLNNGIVDRFVDDAEASDETKDTIEDYDGNRSTGSITAYGSSPALLITPDAGGLGAGNLVIGTVVESVRDTADDDADDDVTEVLATFAYDYGVINRGSITATGLNVGFEATGARIAGSADGGRATIVDGGMQNTGGITAIAYEANATALAIGPHAVVARVTNGGSVTASVTTDTDHRATAIAIDGNSVVTEIANTGSITAAVNATGSGGSAVAILDRSGSLASIINQGTVAAGLTIDEEDFVSGTSVAIDAAGHGADRPVTILQTQMTPTDDVDGDGTVDLDDVTTPAIRGDVLLGAGADTLDVRAGTVTAARVDLGAGFDNLLVANGATVSAHLANVENLVIDAATVAFQSVEPITLDQLTVTGDSELIISTDLRSDGLAEPRLTVTNVASFDTNATITTKLEGFVNDELDVDLIKAGQLVLNDVGSQLTVTTPAIYNTTVAVDATSLTMRLAPKTAAELGLTGNEANAFTAVLNRAADDSTVGAALASYVNPDELAADYPQLLPDYSGAAAKMLASELSLATGSIGARLETIHDSGPGQWFELSLFGADQNATADMIGYTGFGVSMQTGLEFALARNAVAGAGIALRDARQNLDNTADHEINWTAYDATLYFSYAIRNLSLAAAGFGGYLQNFSDRTVSFGGFDETYHGEWDGYYFAGSSKIAYMASFGRFFLTPSVTVDYLDVNQTGYAETSDNDTTGLVLAVTGGDTQHLASTFKLSLGRHKGIFDPSDRSGVSPDGRRLRRRRSGSTQQIYVGYRTDLDSTPYQASVDFLASTGNTFTIGDLTDEKNAIVFGATFSRATDNLFVTMGYKGEIAGDYVAHKVHAELRFSF